DGAIEPRPAVCPVYELATLEHPGDPAVGPHDPVLEDERTLCLARLEHRVLDWLSVLGMNHARVRPDRVVDEVLGWVTRYALDLVRDQLHGPIAIWRAPVDRARDV